MAEERDRSLHRHGDPDPSEWDEAQAVTGRENDTPLRGEDTPAVPNSTLASRAKERAGSETVQQVETTTTKRTAKKTSRK